MVACISETCTINSWPRLFESSSAGLRIIAAAPVACATPPPANPLETGPKPSILPSSTAVVAPLILAKAKNASILFALEERGAGIFVIWNSGIGL
jgi:hypothetical protein